MLQPVTKQVHRPSGGSPRRATQGGERTETGGSVPMQCASCVAVGVTAENAGSDLDIDWLTAAKKPAPHRPAFWQTKRGILTARRHQMTLRVQPEGDAFRGTVTAGSWAKATLLLRTEGWACWWTEWTADRLAADAQGMGRAAA